MHQRGKRVAFLNIMSLGPIQLHPILSGYLADRYNWRVNFWVLTAFTAVNLVLVLFFAPETQFERPAIYNTDITSKHMDEPEFASQLVTTGAKHSKKGRVCSAETEGAEHENTPNYWQELTLIKGVNMNNIGRHIVRLLACIRYPAVSWAFLVGGTFSGWVFLISHLQKLAHYL